MKLVTFESEDGSARVGARLDDGRLLDLAEADGQFEDVSIVALIAEWEYLGPRAAALAAGVDELPPGAFAPAGARLLAPIPRPVSMRDGYAFRQHVATARRNRGLDMIPEFDLFPVFYFTNHLAVIGPGELRVGRSRLAKLDYELEAFCVIGKRVTNPTLEEADDAIFGYGVMNDFSARALQMEEMKLNLGPAKGKDFATAIGPWLVTKDELAPHLAGTPKGNVLHARMIAEVNGERLSDGNVDQMDWTFAQIVQRAADGVTLEPGEVIGSGTVGTGCLLELNGSKVTHDRWLVPGDVVSLAIEGLGTLTNTVVSDSSR
jgi:fumarylacetoacetate (FAA) hydrolase